jgi:hypothetical protein
MRCGRRVETVSSIKHPNGGNKITIKPPLSSGTLPPSTKLLLRG